MPLRYFEDFQALLQDGHAEPIDIGSSTLTAEGIIEFARVYDPQLMHTDPHAARESIYGGLIASGWQTVGTYMRLLVDAIIGPSDSLGSPGIDKLRWLKPVRPGDTLRGRFTVLEATRSKSRPGRGIVRSLGEMVNQNDDVVMTVEAANFFGCRPTSD